MNEYCRERLLLGVKGLRPLQRLNFIILVDSVFMGYKTEHLFPTCMQRYIPVHTSLEGPRLPFCKIKHGIINYFKYFEQKNRIEKGFKK